MDEEVVFQIHNLGLFNQKKNEIILFAGKWMYLEIIMLTKISQTPKDKYSFFHMQILIVLKDRKAYKKMFWGIGGQLKVGWHKRR
jgi:hypothetical protein